VIRARRSSLTGAGTILKRRRRFLLHSNGEPLFILRKLWQGWRAGSILRHGNWLITAALVCVALAVIHWPYITGDTSSSAPTTAATLAGALFGAAAIFAGAQINEATRQRIAVAQLQEQRARVRSALSNEFVRVSINMLQNATQLLLMRRSFLTQPSSLHFTDFDKFRPLPTPAFRALRIDILCLPEDEIDALCTFEGGLDATRRVIDEAALQAKTGGGALVIDRLLQNVAHDLETGAEVARKMWPSRKVQPPREPAYVLADGLKKQADTINRELLNT
jgi:hypothetical protein